MFTFYISGYRWYGIHAAHELACRPAREYQAKRQADRRDIAPLVLEQEGEKLINETFGMAYVISRSRFYLYPNGFIGLQLFQKNFRCFRMEKCRRRY